MFAVAEAPARTALSALMPPVVYCKEGRNWLYQPGVDAESVLSIHTQRGLRLRLVGSQMMDLTGLPAGDYLLRVQLTTGDVYVLTVHLD